MALGKILWVDDEIESLQSQKLFLENKGYQVNTLTNGFDAIDYVKENGVDVVLIDESMPGITGLETLAKIKDINPQIPVVLITKNETENLMNEAIGSQISDYLIKPEEEQGAKIAILLHDIGHGPFSHALEKRLIKGVHHEDISALILQLLNEQFGGQLQTAIDIFSGTHPKPFLHQLVSGQLDVDRMDYLTRDSFFTGVSEGVIGYDRILKMLVVHNGELMIEEKAIYSVEKFLVARRLMYWQVYLHKTVVVAEKMLVRTIERAQELISNGVELPVASPALEFFLKKHQPDGNFIKHLQKFGQLDDTDVLCTLKVWCTHFDPVLARLSRGLIDRRLLKIKLSPEPFPATVMEAQRRDAAQKLRIGEDEARYFVFAGEAANTTYNPLDEHIKVLFRDGRVLDISQVDNALIHQRLSTPVKKYYLCHFR